MFNEIPDNCGSRASSKLFWGLATAVKKLTNIFSARTSNRLLKWNNTEHGEFVDQNKLKTIDDLLKQQFFRRTGNKCLSEYLSLTTNYSTLLNNNCCKDYNQVMESIATNNQEIRIYKLLNHHRQFKMFLQPFDNNNYFEQKINYVNYEKDMIKPKKPENLLQTEKLQGNIVQDESVEGQLKKNFKEMYFTDLFITHDENLLLYNVINSDNIVKEAKEEQSKMFWDTPKLTRPKILTPKSIIITSKMSESEDKDFLAALSNKDHSVVFKNSNKEGIKRKNYSVGIFDEETEKLVENYYSITVNEKDRDFLFTKNVTTTLLEENGCSVLPSEEQRSLSPVMVENNSTVLVFEEEDGKETNVDDVECVHNESPYSSQSFIQYDFNNLKENLNKEESDLNIGYLQVPELSCFKTQIEEKSSHQTSTMSCNKLTKKKLQKATNLATISQRKPKYNFKLMPKSQINRNKLPNLKNILSPVGMYIKNSSRVPQVKHIYKKTTENRLWFEKIPSKVITTKNKENAKDNLPNRLYKPAKQIVVVKKSEEIFSKNIQKLVGKTPEIIKHKRRINKKELDIEKMLLKEDLTGDKSILNFSSTTLQDVSLISIRKVYIK